MNNIKYQGEVGIVIIFLGLFIFIFNKLLNINEVGINVLAAVFIVIGLILMTLWDGES